MSENHYHTKENYEAIRIVSWVHVGVPGTIPQQLEILEETY